MSKSKNIFLGLAVLLVGISAAAVGQKAAPLASRYKNWLDDDVSVIITSTERDVFRKLETDEDRDRFIEAFWNQRDPTPGTPRNEFRDEHYRRIEFADRTFGRGTPFKGRKTDRGRIYIALGPPADVQRYENGDTYPGEIWYFQASPLLGQPANFRILFFQPGGGGDYKIYNPAGNSPKELVPFSNRSTQADTLGKLGVDVKTISRTDVPMSWDDDDFQAYKIIHEYVSPEFAQSTLSNIPGLKSPYEITRSFILLAEVQKYPQKKVDDKYAIDFLEHKATVEVRYSVHSMSNWTALQVYRDPGGFYRLHYAIVPERISIDAYGDVYFADWKATLRLSAADGSTLFQEEKNLPVELRKAELKALGNSAFQYYDALPIIPGACTVNVLLENTVSKEFTTFSSPLSIPAGKSLWMASPLLARQASRIESAPGSAARGFQVGPLKLVPAANNTIGPREKSFLYLQVHNAAPALRAEGRVDIRISRVDRIVYSSKRSLAGSGDVFEILEELPTATLEAGLYAIELSLQDGRGRELGAGRADLNIAAQPIPAAWIFAPPNPPIEDPYYDFVLGTQYLNRNENAEAARALASAYTKKPASLDYALAYSRILMAGGDYARVRSTLSPFLGAKSERFDLFETLGRAAQAAGDYKDAVIKYEKALTFKGRVVGVLNALGECHLKTGDPAKSRVAWQKSLAVDPNQPAIRQALAELK